MVARISDETLQQVYRLTRDGKSSREVAAELGLHHSTVARRVRLEASQDPSLHVNRAPEGYPLRGVSTCRRDADGNLQWVKTAVDRTQHMEAVREAIRDMVREELDGAVVPSMAEPAVSEGLDGLLTIYPLPDLHFGMHAWSKSTKDADFDLKIARGVYRNAVEDLMVSVPSTGEAWILNLGDYLHSDNTEGTTAHGTRQDMDGRLRKIAKEAVLFQKWVISAALSKHNKVRLIIKPGNHDESLLTMMAAAFEVFYEDEPRLEVSPIATDVECHVFGDSLIVAAHGDSKVCKLEKLQPLVSAKWRKEWGSTKRAHAYTGHVHMDRVIEHGGMYLETLRSPAPLSQWAAMQFHSGRDLKADIWHPSRGRIARHVREVF